MIPTHIRKKPNFALDICQSGTSCILCRNYAEGRELRSKLSAEYVTPVGGENFACPYGKPWADRPATSVVIDPPIRIPGGVGTEVTKLLKMLRISEKNCDCVQTAKLWDSWGIEKCIARIDELVKHLAAQGKKRNWLLGIAARLSARQIVEQAIDNAKMEQAKV